MRTRKIALFLALMLLVTVSVIALPAFAEESKAEPAPALADGVYAATFTTDSPETFAIHPYLRNIGMLTVKDGQMNLHVTLMSKSIVNLYLGLKEEAEKEDAVLLMATEDTVDHKDGTEPEAVFGFDVPVAFIGQEFDLALRGEDGTWEDHKVIVTNPLPIPNF